MQPSVHSATRAIEDRERLAARIGVPMSAIEASCERWQVQELALFGSVLRDDFGPSYLPSTLRSPRIRFATTFRPWWTTWRRGFRRRQDSAPSNH